MAETSEVEKSKRRKTHLRNDHFTACHFPGTIFKMICLKYFIIFNYKMELL